MDTGIEGFPFIRIHISFNKYSNISWLQITESKQFNSQEFNDVYPFSCYEGETKINFLVLEKTELTGTDLEIIPVPSSPRAAKTVKFKEEKTSN